MPFFTVIIINWNSWDYLFSCLDALYRQTCQDFAVIVVDNASSDQESAVRLQEYPRLSCILNKKNIGFAAANNQAIRQAESEWIILLNPDTIPEKTCFERLHAAIAVYYPEYSFFGCRLVMASDPNRLDGIGDVYHMSGLSWRAGNGLDVKSAGDQIREIFSPCAAAAMYRRDEILKVDGFDEDFFCYNEDVDLGFRLRLAGYRALSLPDSVVLHYGSGTTGKRSDFSVYYGHRNLVWTWLKNMPLELLLLFLPAHVLYNTACVFLYILRGQGAVILRAKRDALKGGPSMWAKRKRIQTDPRFSISELLKIIDKSLIIGPESKYSKRL